MAICECEMTLTCPYNLSVAYVRDNRLGNIDHNAVLEAVGSLPKVFDEGMGRMKLLTLMPLVCIPLGFVLFALGGYQSVSTLGFSPVIFVGFFTFAAGGIGGFLVRGHVLGLGYKAVESELGKMNERFQGLNFSLRTESHRTRSGVGSDRTSRIIKNSFLVITSLLESGGGPPPVFATVVSTPVTAGADTTVTSTMVGNTTHAGPNFCPKCGAACAGQNFCGGCGSNLR